MSAPIQYPASDGLPGFCLVRKKIKRINMRFSDDGILSVSAPLRMPIRDIRKAVADNIGWVEKTRQRLEQKLLARPELRDGGSIMLLGTVYPLSTEAGRRDSCVFSGDAVTASLRDPSDGESLKRTAERFLRDQAQTAFSEALERMFPLVEPLGAEMPELKIRRMTSRWGTCNTRTRTITLNLCLVRAPMSLIDYVMLHELIHLLESSHGPRFHLLSSQLMPDYLVRRKNLNSLDLIY